MTVLHGEYICCHNQLSYGDFCMTSAKEYQQRSKSNYLYGVQYLLPHQFQNSSNKTKMLFSSKRFFFVNNSSFQRKVLNRKQCTGTDTAHRYWHSAPVLVKRIDTGLAHRFWYIAPVLVQGPETGTAHRYWYSALVLVKHTGTARRVCAHRCLVVSFYQHTFGAGCRGFWDVLAVSLHY